MSGHPIPAGAPVESFHIELMAARLAWAAQDRLAAAMHPGQGQRSPEYQRAARTHWRRTKALRRLAEALARQPAVQS